MSRLNRHVSLMNADEYKGSEKIDTLSELCSTICQAEADSDKDINEILNWFKQKNIYEGNPQHVKMDQHNIQKALILIEQGQGSKQSSCLKRLKKGLSIRLNQ